MLCILCNRISAASAQYSTDHWEALFTHTGLWAYQTGSPSTDPAWRSTMYNDQSWQHASGSFGYGDGDDSTVIPVASSLMLRIRFFVTDTSQIKRLVLMADYDDAFVAWLDQVEIARSNIGVPGDFPAWNAVADSSHEARVYGGLKPEFFPVNHKVQSTVLHSGWHVLAIQINNDAIKDDLSASFDLMTIIRNPDTLYEASPDWFSTPFHTNLPIIKINTNNQVIPDQPKITATMQIIDNGQSELNFYNDAPNNYDGWIGIERRGSTSQWFPKKPYTIETRDQFGFERNVSLLGMPVENDWILQNPYSDKSLMRNYLVYNLAREMGLYCTRTRYCEVWLNNQYQGVYVFMEQIKWDKNRVNIDHMHLDDNAGDSLTGGYIIKIDKTTAGSGIAWSSPISSFQGQSKHFNYQLDYPKSSYITTPQFNYIKSFMDSFEYALNGNNFRDPVEGYRKYINVQTFIDYYFIMELTKDVDAYRLSTYLSKPRNSMGGKLVAGPVWDFNLSFGNAYYCNGWTSSGWAWDNCAKSSIPFWWERLLQDPDYRQQVGCRWDLLRHSVLDTTRIMDMIDSWYAYIFQASRRNFQQWPVIGAYVWPNYYIGPTYTSEVDWLKNWIRQRIEWLDTHMPHGDQSCLTASWPDPFIITEFNYQSYSSLNGGDWFEIYHPGTDTLNLADWQCSDKDYHHRYVFPAGTLVNPGAYLVVCRDTALFHSQYPGVSNISGPFNWGLGNGGDSIMIYDSLSFKQYAFGYTHADIWGSDGYGRTRELKDYHYSAKDPDNWFDGCMGGSPGKAFEPCNPELAISEINYHSGIDDAAGDWFEMVNLSQHSIDLSGYYLADDHLATAYKLPQGVSISPKQYLLFSRDPAAFAVVYPQTAAPFGPLPFGLNHQGGPIRIFDAAKQLVYSCIYDEKDPWPSAANGWGYTIEQLDFSKSPDDGLNWASFCPGGSPGSSTVLPCLIASGMEQIKNKDVLLFPNPATDYLYFIIDNPKSNIQVSIYNLLGERLEYFPVSTSSGSIDISNLPQGTYILTFEQDSSADRFKFIKQ